MRRLSFGAVALVVLGCSEPTGPSSIAGEWASNNAPITGGYVAVNAVIAESGGVLSGSGTLTINGCPGSPYAITISGARAGTAVSFTLIPRDINFTGTYAANSIEGTLTGVICGGIGVGPLSLVLTR
jgi:hypothetical protein